MRDILANRLIVASEDSTKNATGLRTEPPSSIQDPESTSRTKTDHLLYTHQIVKFLRNRQDVSSNLAGMDIAALAVPSTIESQAGFRSAGFRQRSRR
ncbi:MAG: hypothetical protein C5B55_03020 [Blastocatellia bacterium]|nr:MAG: hypothetical protein C5B55_03020 [Blastocatellia bacterium]